METTALQVNLRQEITDESIAARNANNTSLLLQCDPFSFQYAVLDNDRNKIIALRDYRLLGQASEFREGIYAQLLDSDNLLKELHPRKIILGIFPLCNLLVPGPLFNRDNIADYLRLADSSTIGVALSDKLRFADVHLVYNLPSGLIAEIESVTGELTPVSANSVLIDQQLMLNKHRDETVMTVNVRHGFMDIVVCDGASLIFSNTFPYHNAEDFIYYLLFTMEQLQLNPDQQEVWMYGDIEKTSASWLVSRKYIRNVNPGNRPEGAAYSYGFSKLPAHQYFSLFSQQLCVS